MPQLLLPDSDVSVGGWVQSTGGTLFACIDEVSPSDTDFIGRTGVAAPGTYEVGLTNGTDPGVDTGHVLWYRYLLDFAGGTSTIRHQLYQGATLIAQSAAIAPVAGAGFVTGSYNLTTPEAAAITDYTDLRIRGVANISSGGRTIQVSWAQLEIPNAPTSGQLAMLA